jgi:hypothetical protein
MRPVRPDQPLAVQTGGALEDEREYGEHSQFALHNSLLFSGIPGLISEITMFKKLHKIRNSGYCCT